jgi:dCTP deaminase
VVRNDRWISEMARQGMIEPFGETQKRDGVISYGVGSYGYDMRLGEEFRIFMNNGGSFIDPKQPALSSFTQFRGEVCIIPPNSFALGMSLEYFRIPRDVLAICFGKSTYARCGLIVNITPLEPEWEGHVTMAISNTTPLPAKVYANEGIAQVVFLQASESCITSYKDKAGKYQAQKGITLSKL